MQWILLTLTLLLCPSAQSQSAPNLLLATSFSEQLVVEDYWVSEKLDGVRAYWDGKKLISRGGQVIHAPLWFITKLPNTALDGELWLGRGQFEKTLSIVRTQTPNDEDWRLLRYGIFELPNGEGTFTERLNVLHQLINAQHNAQLFVIPQHTFKDRQTLMKYFHSVVNEGGEGIMLHRKAALYSTGRSGDLIKLKPLDDAEATVIGYKAGKGKYQQLTGALLVRNTEGREFFIGSGLSVALRQNPPAIGTVITYQHSGFTAQGIPRHARFLRLRVE